MLNAVAKGSSRLGMFALACALMICGACAQGEVARVAPAGQAGGGGGTTQDAGSPGAQGGDTSLTTSPDAATTSGAGGAANVGVGGGGAGSSVDAASAAGAGGGASVGSDAGAANDGGGGAPPANGLHVVGYLPNYNGSYSSWATKLSFDKMTHLNLAFALATSANQWDMGASDADVKAIVDAAHAAGVKVLPSLGGGGGDQTVLARYNDPNSVGPLVDNLNAFVAAHDFDGVDIDIESPENLGKSYSTFVDMVVAKLRPEGKLVTAAVAQYLQDSMSDATLHEFDFVNVMIYSSLSDTMQGATYYTKTKNVPKNLVVLGAGFFGNGGNDEYAYADILKADPTAWSKDQATVQGATVHYEGMATMKQIADLSKGFGGIMVWELTQDTFDAHSLFKVIQGEM